MDLHLLLQSFSCGNPVQAIPEDQGIRSGQLERQRVHQALPRELSGRLQPLKVAALVAGVLVYDEQIAA